MPKKLPKLPYGWKISIEDRALDYGNGEWALYGVLYHWEKVKTWNWFRKSYMDWVKVDEEWLGWNVVSRERLRRLYKRARWVRY